MSALSNEVALVTGGASGLGRGLCIELGRRGAEVVISDVNLEGAKALATEIEASGGSARAIELDVTSASSIQAAIDDIAQRGRLDYVFNNAGIGVGGEFQDIDARQIERIIAINLTGAALVMNAAYKVMVRQRSGQIVNIASMWGLSPAILQSLYAATKHGLVALTLSVAPEARALGISLSVVCPGYIATNLFKAGSYGGDLDAAAAVERIPFTMIDVETAVAQILRGVHRKRLLIVFPFYVKLLWWTQRFAPWLVQLLSAIEVRKQRREFGSTASRLPE